MSSLTRDGTPEPTSRDQILRREQGGGNINFPCSSYREEDWQPYPVGPYSAIILDIYLRRVIVQRKIWTHLNVLSIDQILEKNFQTYNIL